MKKVIIYGLILIMVFGGVFYFTLDKDDKDMDNIGQGEETPEANEDQVPDISDEDVIEIGKKLPDFTLVNRDGEEKSLRDYEGQITILNFWESWCPPCKQEMPDFQKIHEEYDDILILTVNMEKEKDRGIVDKFLDDNGYSFEVLLDQKQEVARKYYISSIPTTFFIDKEGIFRGNWPGMLTLEQMEEAIDTLRGF